MMIFISTPADVPEAAGLAADIAFALREFASYGVAPVIVMEPVTKAGNLDFKAYRGGAYDAVLEVFFAALRAEGITDEKTGLFVPFPEANIPEWGNTDPGDFAACFTKTVQIYKKYFPGGQAAVLLDSKSYPSGTSWEGGAYASLAPYLTGIPKGLADSFALQGYPWPDPQPDYSAGNFVRPSLAIEAASILGVKEVWLSTGTFATGKAWNGQRINLSPEQRGLILKDVLARAAEIKAAGYQTSVHVFAENKLSTSEGIDWSYWPAGGPVAGPAADVLAGFLTRAAASGIGIGLFDN